MSLKKNNFYQNYFSELALSLARINKFITKENPSVGCVVTDFNNNILSSGVTSKNGRPHAENNALIKLNKKITKKIFVTLEPCNHYGKTAPCTKKIVNFNVKQLHCNQIDKNPAVNGSGLKFLKENKIKTFNGLDMFIYQGQKSFYLWNKINPEIDQDLINIYYQN